MSFHRRVNQSMAIATLSLCLMLSACASRFGAAPVPPLASLPASAPSTQHLVFEHGSERHELLAVLRHDERSLRMALLSPQGQRLLTLEQDERGVRFLDGAVFDPPFSAQWLLERLSWSLWPVEQLQHSFQGSAWSVRQHAHGHDIYHRKQRVASITDTGACHIVDDLQAGYRLYRSTLEPDSHQGEPPCPVR